MIPSFTSLYSFITFIKTNSSLLTDSIKTLEIKTSRLFNLDFANNAILSCYFLLIINLYFLIAAVTVQMFNPVAAFVIPIGIPTKEAK